MASKVDYSNLTILFFAKAKEVVKKSSLVVQLPSKFDSLDDLLQKVEVEFPELKILNRCFVLALNQNYLMESDKNDQNGCLDKHLRTEITLNDGDELAVIPPLSGG